MHRIMGCCCGLERPPTGAAVESVAPQPDDAVSGGTTATFTLPSDYDATAEYYQSFSKRDEPRASDVVVRDDLLQSARSTLSEKPTPRQVTSGFAQYELAIETERDGQQRRVLIDEYERQKDALDRTNPHDAEAAQYYVTVARSAVANASQRLDYYRRAIAHTNTLEEKRALQQEYVAFCARFITGEAMPQPR